MRIALEYGPERMEVEVAAERLVLPRTAPPAPLLDPVAAVRTALETPFAFPALRRALTPDDRITIVVDERLPEVGKLLVPILEHIAAAGVSAKNVTLLCPPSESSRSTNQTWLDALPEEFEDATCEVHNPDDRKRLAYLATMREGKRLYLNRSLVESDQAVVLTGRRYDVLLGHGGAEGLLYPTLSDAETRQSMDARYDLSAPDRTTGPVRREAVETAWLLGAPFFVQVIEGAGNTLAAVVAGTNEASVEGARQLDKRWRVTVPRPANVVVAALSGDPAKQSFADLAIAAANAARVVEPGGRIVLLSRVARGPEAGGDVLLSADDADSALTVLSKTARLDHVPVLHWAAAARHAHLTLLSELDDDTTENLFAAPLHDVAELQRLLDGASSYFFLDDAHKSLTLLAKE